MPCLRRTRGRILSSWVGLALVAAICAASCGIAKGADKNESDPGHFCAIMADSVGLYAGNPVTQMGYQIGTVDGITPSDTGVEVRFTVAKHRQLPHDVKAVTRSTSILADRSLELVGNYKGGQQLAAGQCIPRANTETPLSISQVIGSATNFVNGMNPDGSTNIQDALRGIDEAVKGNGPALNHLLATSSSLLDSPDQGLADIGSTVRNVVKLTDMLKDVRPPLKEVVLNTQDTFPYLVRAVGGATELTGYLPELVGVVADLEVNLGDDLQVALDGVSDTLRHFSPHYKGIANLLNPVPRFINTASRYINGHQFDLIAWSPPLFRIATPNGLALCGQMNASMPGSCADVNGQPHAVDIALLQYVLMEAQRR